MALFFCGTAAAIELKLADCTLQVGAAVLKPVAVVKPFKMEYRLAGKHRFLVDKNELIMSKQDGRRRLDRSSRRKATTCTGLLPKRTSHIWLGYQVDEDGGFTGYDSAALAPPSELEYRFLAAGPPAASRR